MNTYFSEAMILEEICKVFISALPLITAESFEFLDCERSTVYRPSITPSY